MSLLFRFEKWLENQVERFFGPRESVQPVEIARRMVRVMEEQSRISVQRTYVPNSFVVHVCSEDMAELASIMNTLGQDLANHVKTWAQRQSFAFPGPVSVQFAEEAGLRRGETRIVASFVEGVVDEEAEEKVGGAQPYDEMLPDADDERRSGDTGLFRKRPAAGAAGSVPGEPGADIESTQFYKSGRKAGLVWRIAVEEGPDTGADFTVRLPATIGRRQGCDVQLHDPKVSRLHARLEQTPEGAMLVDADSTNGVRINGRVVRRAMLSPGDRIEVGVSHLVIRSVGGE